MQHHEFLDLSQQVWDEAYEQHRRSFHVVPKPLTPEQASALFAKAVRTSALSLLYMYANSDPSSTASAATCLTPK